MIAIDTAAEPGRSFGPEDLRQRTKRFALHIISLSRVLPRSEEARVISKQMLRSATGMAANYRSACRARSGADFISKIGITLEEADETAFWLELLIDAGVIEQKRINTLLSEANELIRIFAASRSTARSRE